jgi:hypothetical protein
MNRASRTVWRVAAAAGIGGLSAILAMLVSTYLRGAIVLEMDRDMPRTVIRGVYPTERAGDLTFAWTSERADIVLAGLNRDRRWDCRIRLRAGRTAPLQLPKVDITVDGIAAASIATTNDFQDAAFEVPQSASNPITRISLKTSPTFVPGPKDQRTLGVQIDRFSCEPIDGRVFAPPIGVMWAVASVGAIFGAAAALGGLPVFASSLIGSFAAVAQAVALHAGIAAYTRFVGVTVELAIWISVALLVLTRVTEAARRQALSTFSRATVFAAGAALYAELLGLLHPAKLPIDAVFHAHRFQTVLAGNYFFTQPMPGGVSFPYAIGLYLFAAPWAWVTSDHVSLLRIVVCASDLASYLLLYWLVVRQWKDHVAAAVLIVLAITLPIALDTTANANLTNEFGHAAANVALVIACAHATGRFRIAQFAGVLVVGALAFLSHVSTVALLAVTLITLATLFWCRPEAGARGDAVRVGTATMLALLMSFLVYYGHFTDVYVNALRIRGQTKTEWANTTQSPSEAVQPRGLLPSSVPMRAVNAAGVTVNSLGWPVLALAGVGAWRLMRERRHDRVVLLIVACSVTYVVFVAVGLIRVDAPYQRYTAEFIGRVVLATSPAALLLAAVGASWGFARGLVPKTVAWSLVAAAAVLAVRQWLAWFS